MVRKILARFAMFAGTLAACWWLTSTLGSWAAVGVWAAAMALACGATAALLRRVEPGRVTLINRVAAYTLPWGYRIGRGQLLPIVLTSWLGWVLAGTAAALVVGAIHGGVAGPGDGGGHEERPGWIVPVLLYASWIIDGAALSSLIGAMAASGRGRIPRSLIAPTVGFAAIIAGGVALAAFGRSTATRNLALLLSGGPPLVIGIGYGLFVLTMVVAGRHARWN